MFIRSGELSLGNYVTSVPLASSSSHTLHSPLGYYFVSCSHDRTARLWSTEQVTPLRIFAGHSSDVDVCAYILYNE